MTIGAEVYFRGEAGVVIDARSASADDCARVKVRFKDRTRWVPVCDLD